MSILSGFFKTKKYRKTPNGYKLQSLWTSSETVEMGDGNTVETNLGAIQGITSSLATENDNYALSATAGKNLQDQITTVNTDLSNHTANKTNPHGVTKEQIGLGNVNNTSDTDKHVKYAESANCANFLNDGKYEFTTATLTEKFAKGIRLIGIYQQDITLAGGGTFFQSIPSQYQNPAYIYTINCAGNSLNFLANMETYAMAVRNISSDTLSTTVQVYAFAAGL